MPGLQWLTGHPSQELNGIIVIPHRDYTETRLSLRNFK